MRTERGYLAERIVCDALQLEQRDNQYLFLNEQGFTFTYATPDAETVMCIIEIKDMSTLCGEIKEKKLLKQALRYALLAQEQSRYSVLITGKNTKIPESIRSIYDIVIRAPLLGTPLSNFHPDDYQDESELGAVGGAPRAESSPYLDEEYIIESRGCPPVLMNQIMCLEFLHGHHISGPVSHDEITPIPGPAQEDLIRLLYTLLHLVPEIDNQTECPLECPSIVRIIDTPRIRGDSHPLTQADLLEREQYWQDSSQEGKEEALDEALRTELEQIEYDLAEEYQGKLSQAIETNQPTPTTSALENTSICHTQTEQDKPSTHRAPTRREKLSARQEERAKQHELMREEMLKNLQKKSRKKDNSTGHRKKAKEPCTTAPNTIDYTELFEQTLAHIFEQQEHSKEIQQQNRNILKRLEYVPYSQEKQQTRKQRRHNKTQQSSAEEEDDTEGTSSPLPTGNRITISDEEKITLRKTAESIIGASISEELWAGLLILFEEEGVDTEKALSDLRGRALSQDRLRLIIRRLYQTTGNSFLPEIAISCLYAFFPSLGPRIFLGASNLGMGSRSLISSAFLNTIIRSLIEVNSDMLEYLIQEHIEPLYHDQHRTERIPNVRHEPGLDTLGHIVNNSMGSILLARGEDYLSQQREFVSTFMHRFRQPLPLDEKSSWEIAATFSRSGMSSQEVLSNLIKRSEPTQSRESEALMLHRNGIDYQSNMPGNHPQRPRFDFANRLMLGIRYRMLTGANSISEMLERLQEKNIMNWRTQSQDSTKEGRMHYLRLVTIASYLNQQNDPERLTWQDFIDNLATRNSHPLEGQPIASKLGNHTMNNLANPNSYTEADSGLFYAILFYGGNLESRIRHNDPNLDYPGRAFREIPDQRQFAYPEVALDLIGLQSITVFISTLLSDFILDNNINQEGLGRAIWLDPNHLDQTREAIRRLQGREHNYRRDSRYGLHMPNQLNTVMTAFLRETTHTFSNIYRPLGLLALPFVHFWDAYSATQTLRQMSQIREQEARQSTEEARVLIPNRGPSAGTTLRKRANRKK